MTDEEIQKMQDLEQAELDKAYEIGYQVGYEEGKGGKMIEISIHIPSLLIGCFIGVIAMGIIMITFELFDFDRSGLEIKHKLIELEAKLTELKKEEV